MRIQVDGAELYFDVEGAKLRARGPKLLEVPTIVLLHGGPGGDHSLMKPEYAALADVAQLVYLDLRGHGRSSRDTPDHWTLDRWGLDIHRFCGALGIERPIVLGSSFGGFVALAYAIAHPHEPAALILSSTAGRLRIDRICETFGRVGGPAVRAMAEAFFAGQHDVTLGRYLEVCGPYYRHGATDPDRFGRAIENAALSDWFFRPGGEATAFDFLPRLASVHCPALILVGEDDPVTTAQDADDLAAAFPAGLAQVRRFPGCGHIVAWENPAAEISAIRQFLGTLSTKADGPHAETQR